MSQNVEPPIIDYARFYALVQNHLEHDPLQALTLPENLGSFDSLLDDPPELFHIQLTNVKVPEERLAIDAGAASFLSSIAESVKYSPSQSDQDLGIERHRVRRMKHELPLLRSDHDIDVLRFAAPIVPDLENEFLPFETADVEEDEGLEWPSSYDALPDQFAKKSRSEKIEASEGDFLYLQQTLKFRFEGVDHGALEVDELSYKRRTIPEPASPPLLPLSPSPEPYVPSSDTGHLDFLSDTTSPTREEAREVERTIFADDRILPIKKQDDSPSQNSDPMLLETESLGDIYSPLKGIKNPPSSPSPFRERPKDLKVEVPLSPSHSEQPPPWKRKSVSFSEALPELIPELPLPITKPEDTSSDDIDAFFESIIKPVAAKAERAIEQEQLQEADTTLRVSVPIMDFSLPIAPWKAKSHGPKANNEGEALKKTLTKMKALHFSKHVWPTSGEAERELKWAPFPVALGKVETQESIPDNGFIDKYIVPPEPVDITTLTWKPDGLRIFDELAESDEEELEEGDFPEEKDINSLVRKRKLELEAGDLVSPPSEDVSRTANARTQGKQNANTAVAKATGIVSKPTKETTSKGINQEVSFTNSFSAMSALEDYINVRKGQMTRRKVTSDHHFAKQSQVQQLSEPADLHPPKRVSQIAIPAPAQRAPVLDAPTLSLPSSPHFFIVSASFLRNRSLSRQVQRVYPSAEFIERDFMLHQQGQFEQRPQSKVHTTSMNFGTMADEADVLLSPSTGLIWTSLQKIKQLALPGQINRSAVRERVSRTSLRYERLLVLVSQNQNTAPSSDRTNIDIQPLDDKDCTALAEFTAFCSTLPDEVQSIFIAGGEEDLAKWIVAAMVKHGLNTDQEFKLLQDETLWEVFLRRAGMNAFAAQAILATLKAPGRNEIDAAGTHGTAFGLTAFAKMSVQERFAHFETLLGGRRLLGRVSRVLDARW
ncbi:hypothetical protein HO133_007142 [Letharia lupina]|uniref:Uncharacterized protein n=1 Tax=Letharia lupina TaxID=560253 RepID=A0A8H6FIA2_9LECA|nr:uncharacterized protein HO133_007142 [Letharia lupina]KAF6229028.1 hypothetical protein HO133_007142 [Letharia lupina]